MDNGGLTPLFFAQKCQKWLENNINPPKALLTQSGTSALEMAALLLDIQPGDEIIMPSYTFVSTANAFVLRGAVPVFIDIRRDTLNLDETLIEARRLSRVARSCKLNRSIQEVKR